MTVDQTILLAIAAATLAAFLWGRWRHDVVAMAALLACVFSGLVGADETFAGFGHPAVVTVAAVLMLSHGLQITGAVNVLAARLLPSSGGPTTAIAALITLGTLLSAFMNNVGALALLMPIAIRTAAKHQIPPGRALMPLAFGSMLGGMTTLIGTPPNLIVSGFRAESGGRGFGIFDFTPVGLAIAVAGVLFLILVGWRLVPKRERAGAASFETGTYFTEVRVTERSKAVGQTLRDLEPALLDADAQVVGLVRNDMRVTAPNPYRLLREGDIIVIEAEPESLSGLLSVLGLKLEEETARAGEEGAGEEPRSPEAAAMPAPVEAAVAEDDESEPAPESRDVVLLEVAVLPSSPLIGRSASDLLLRTRWGLNLLAISHQGQRTVRRLRSTPLQAGDVLLLQGAPDTLAAFAGDFQCVPLAERAIHIPDATRATAAMAIMGAALAAAALGLTSAPVAFVTAAVAFMVLRIVPPESAYDAIDWPVVVLLAALMPVAGAMVTSGTADLIAGVMQENLARGNPVLAVGVLLVATMTLSAFMSNAATAAMMAPLAISTSRQLDVNPDTFLMAVAVGASCAFLTPIGHQNSTLILGPGGFRFGDYWRLGLPLTLLVVAIGVPMLLWTWPL
jgi:di/tricarboxylate transporter